MVKKVNAVCGLAVSVSVLIHIVYVIYAYLTFYYNPLVTRIIADTTLLFAGIHIIFSAVTVFFLHDRGNGMLYPRLNIRTLIQRVSAVLMILMLILHINTFKLLSSSGVISPLSSLTSSATSSLTSSLSSSICLILY